MVCLPATQFCCGCTVTFGVKSILLLNFALNAYLIFMCAGDLIFGQRGLSLGSYSTECVALGFAMAGMPIIVMAFHGIFYRNEAQIRMYLYYMWVLFAIVLIFVVKEFVLSGACQNLSQVLQGQGSAFACGMARYMNIVIVVLSLSIMSYFQHVVLSFCEDIAACGGGPDLSHLTLNKKRWQPTGAYSSIEGLAESSEGSLAGLGGGQTIFGGRYHEMNYPPHASA